VTEDAAPEVIGFVGLGQMGGPMAANIAAKGFDLVVFDIAPARPPDQAITAGSLVEAAGAADSLFLSLPDGRASLAVLSDLAAMAERRAATVIDLSTIGPEMARAAAEIAKAAGITYIDAPVSGGQAGARAGTVTLMWAGPVGEMERHRAVLATFCKHIFHVGDAAGQGQSLKVLNNFLSGTAMAATSEAILYGLSQGLDMKTMLDVINVSTGQNTATRDKFPARILSETFDAGFTTALISKDIKLFLENAEKAGSPTRVGALVSDIWNNCDAALPGSDFTKIYQYIQSLMKP
jgi:3-hydroxyisobutyrate dehydrogenase-like beta-hydroxyacid dehydrogenase